MALAVLAGWAVASRNVAFHERAFAEATARPVTVRLAGGAALPARPGISSASVLAALVADRGSAAGLRLSVRLLDLMIAPGFAAVDVDARGSEEALRALARAIEGDRPAVRLIRWSIRPAGDGLLRLEARAVAPIGGGQ